jgi:hypothetical protein
MNHEKKCGGAYFKVFEIQRTDATSGKIEKKYVRNVKYMNPQPQKSASSASTSSSAADVKHELVARTQSQIRAVIDLTDDTPKEQNLCAVINLDDSEFCIDDEPNSSQYVLNLISHCNSLMNTCCLCKVAIGESRLACHFDTCTGFQQQIIYPF